MKDEVSRTMIVKKLKFFFILSFILFAYGHSTGTHVHAPGQHYYVNDPNAKVTFGLDGNSYSVSGDGFTSENHPAEKNHRHSQHLSKEYCPPHHVHPSPINRNPSPINGHSFPINEQHSQYRTHFNDNPPPEFYPETYLKPGGEIIENNYANERGRYSSHRLGDYASAAQNNFGARP